MNGKREGFYRAYEDRFRGSRDLIKSRLQVYFRFVDPLRVVYPDAWALDLGCGRGEWVELLSERGFRAVGVDVDEGMLAVCRECGLDARKADALDYLKSLPDEYAHVISAFHVVEHLAFDKTCSLIEESVRTLRPGGVLILETPNPENLLVAGLHFYADPTHRRPLPPLLLSFLAEYGGFERIKILRLQEAVDLGAKRRLSLLDVLGGVSPDYAVVARKKGPPEVVMATEQAFAGEQGLTLEELASRYERERTEREQTRETAVQRMEASARHVKEKVKDVERRLQQMEERVAGMKEEVHRLQKHAARVESELREATSRLEAVYRSRSWRITRPLRSLSELVTAARRRANAVLKRLVRRVLGDVPL
jgi:O-antigen chain-terminating methyltransferase